MFKEVDINRDALQMSGNCWIHAGVNAMNQSAKTKSYLNNLIVKNQNGNYTVFLVGARNLGEPKPNGDGIYTFRGASTGQADTTGGSFMFFLIWCMVHLIISKL